MMQEWEEHEVPDQPGEPGMEEPEADVVEQRRPLDDADEPEVVESSGRVREADDADVQEQSRALPPEEDYPG